MILLNRKFYYVLQQTVITDVSSNIFKIWYLQHSPILSLEKLGLDGDGEVHSPMEFVIKKQPMEDRVK